MSRKIRVLKAADYPAFTRINQRAYAGFFNGTAGELEASTEVYKKICGSEDATGFGVFEEETLIGGMIFYTFNYNFHGTIIAMAGIGSVAVDLLHKKEKVARDMIQFALRYAEELKIPLFTLYPFRADFYRKFGFGYGMSLKHIKTGPENFRPFANKNILIEVDKNDVDLLVDYYNDLAKVRPGMTFKSEADIRRFNGYDGATYLKAEVNGSVAGYMVFTQKKLSDTHSQFQMLEVLECLYDSPQALFAFSDFLHSQKDQMTCISWHSFDENLFRILNHISYAPEERMMPLIAQKYGDIGTGVMYLALDIEKLLSIIFDGKDVSKVNWHIKNPDDSLVNISCGNRGESVDIYITIQGLSTWVSGSASLETLRWSGELTCDESLEEIDRVLSLESPNFLSRF